MSNRACSRWVSSKACLLVECKIADSCRYWEFDDETNEAFLEAIDKTMMSLRPRLLHQDGEIQFCEQCNGTDGKAVEIGIGTVSVRMLWAHNAWDSGICRMVYICDSCFREILADETADSHWFDAAMYGIDPECAACQAELPASVAEL